MFLPQPPLVVTEPEGQLGIALRLAQTGLSEKTGILSI